LAKHRLIGLLPLALAGASADGDLERALLLRDSLDRNWRGAGPFPLKVVTRDPDYLEVASTLGSTGRVAVDVHRESDFFARGSAFFTLPGWWKQQIVKLLVAAALDADAVITLDADVISIRSFGPDDFLRDDRVVSIWVHRNLHDWWRNTARTLDVPHDETKWGLSVTPNVLSPTLARMVIQEVERRFGQPFVDVLSDWSRLFVPGSAWTEYSLYTLVGDQLGKLFEVHLAPHEVRATGVVLHSSCNIWTYVDPRERLIPERLGKGEYFLIVQSTAGINTNELRALLGYPCPDATAWQTKGRPMATRETSP
jgi:hypothetical protein